jgi:hypothetical protein
MRFLLTTVRKPTSASTTSTSDISLPWNWLWCHASKVSTVHHLRLHTWLCPRLSILHRSLSIINLFFGNRLKKSHLWLTLNIKIEFLLILSERPNPYIVNRSEITVSVGEMTSLRQLAVACLVKVPASRSFILKVYIRGATTTAICCVICI